MGKKKDSENIRVVIRCRNLLPYEVERGDKAAVRLDLATQQIVVNHAIGDPEAHAFDAVYNNTFTQRDIFIQEVQPLVEAVLQGYNATVFAYGQSGSGKTFTMTGSLKDPTLYGMMPQVVEYLFNEIRKLTSPTKTFKVKVSYVELYNGKSRDLLSSNHQQNLEIKQNLSKNFYVKGAEMPEVTNFDECIRYFNLGTDRRQTASTDLNDQSSRSHSLFSMTVDQFDFEQDPSSPVVLTSKINVVDLAGSEKLSKTNATGETVKEGCNINLSLTALAHVIDKIVKGDKHVPYRGSPLTMLLKDSLGGNAKTVMFANCGPSEKNISETISTVKFALRAKQIENKPIKNLDPKDARIQELLEKIEALQKRLGGNLDPAEEENLAKRIEELECENAELRGAQGKDMIELEELAKSKQAQIEALSAALRERDAEVQTSKERCELVEANLRSEQDHSGELKSLMGAFIRRVCSEAQLQSMRGNMPNDGSYNTSEDSWDVRELQWYLEGFLALYDAWRTTAMSDEDVKRVVQRNREELEQQFQRTAGEMQREREELLRQREEENLKRASESESVSQMRVEFAAQKEECTKLREKIERDQEKFKQKLEKAKEAHKATTTELETTKSELTEAQRDVEKLRKLLEGNAARGLSASGIGSPHRTSISGDDRFNAVLETERNEREKLKSQLNETKVLLRRKGFCIRQNGDAALDLPVVEGDAPSGSDAFVLEPLGDDAGVDGDSLAVLQQQIRVQHRLSELRLQQQRKLDDMIRKLELLKTGSVTPLATSGGASDEQVQEKVAEALAARNEEVAAMTAEHEATMDKLVKRINKKMAEFQEQEAALSEEKVALEEERADLRSANDELQRLNQQMAVEIGTLRDQLSYAKSDVDNQQRMKESEIAHLKAEQASLIAQLDAMRNRLEETEHVQADFQRLQLQNQRTEAALKDKISTLENNRQTLKWSNALLEQEREKVSALTEDLKRQEAMFKEQEEHWRGQLIENANKIVAMNNKRFEEQAQQFQSLIGEEQEKQKAIREKLRKAKSVTQKAAQRYDEMVLEYEQILVQLEDMKVSAMKMFREKQEAQRDLDAMRPMVGHRKF